MSEFPFFVIAALSITIHPVLSIRKHKYMWQTVSIMLRVKSTGLEIRKPGFEYPFSYSLAVQPWQVTYPFCALISSSEGWSSWLPDLARLSGLNTASPTVPRSGKQSLRFVIIIICTIRTDNWLSNWAGKGNDFFAYVKIVYRIKQAFKKHFSYF